MTAPDAPSPDDEHDLVRLTVPALPGYGRVARLAMTGLASRNAFPYDEVEDVRIAVGELFGILVEPPDADDRLAFTCTLRPGRIEIAVHRSDRTSATEIGPLSHQILDAVVDATQVAPRGEIRITKVLGDPR